VPQNASLSLGITILASALYAGSRVLCGRRSRRIDGGPLTSPVAASGPPEGRLDIVKLPGQHVLERPARASTWRWSLHREQPSRVGGSCSRPFSRASSACWTGRGTGCLHRPDLPLREGVGLITDAVTRLTAKRALLVNGVLVEEALYPRLRDALIASLETLTLGNPYVEGTRVGPLFSQGQPRVCGSSSPRKAPECCPAGRAREPIFIRPSSRGRPRASMSGRALRSRTLDPSRAVERRCPLAWAPTGSRSATGAQRPAGRRPRVRARIPRAAHLRERGPVDRIHVRAVGGTRREA